MDGIRLPEKYEDWETVDFRPAPPGWRTVHLIDHADGGIEVEAFPMAGWLIQHGGWRSAAGDWLEYSPRRRVVPGDLSLDGGAEVGEAATQDYFWKVVAPGEPTPSEAEAREELARREREGGRHLVAVEET